MDNCKDTTLHFGFQEPDDRIDYRCNIFNSVKVWHCYEPVLLYKRIIGICGRLYTWEHFCTFAAKRLSALCIKCLHREFQQIWEDCDETHKQDYRDCKRQLYGQLYESYQLGTAVIITFLHLHSLSYVNSGEREQTRMRDHSLHSSSVNQLHQVVLIWAQRVDWKIHKCHRA